MAPDGLASAPHPPANRGGAVGGAAAASPEPPGLRRPKASHPPAGRPEPRAAPPALPFAGAGGERPALRDSSPAPGRLPQMAVGRGRRVEQIIDRVVLEQFIARLPKKTAQWVQCHRPASLDLAIQLAEDQMVACHGVGETLPSVSLSLPSPSFSPPTFLPRSRAGVVPRAQPRWRGCPALESGRRGQPARAPLLVPFPRCLHANSLSPFPPLGWRGSLGRPAGIAGTRITLSIVVR